MRCPTRNVEERNGFSAANLVLLSSAKGPASFTITKWNLTVVKNEASKCMSSSTKKLSEAWAFKNFVGLDGWHHKLPKPNLMIHYHH